jgi:hypothetical protein
MHNPYFLYTISESKYQDPNDGMKPIIFPALNFPRDVGKDDGMMG